MAQTPTGTIAGTVTDQSGAVIPNATVRLRQIGSNAEITTTTNASGQYRLRGLPAGVYAASVEANGFKKLTMNGVNVASARTTTNNLNSLLVR